MNDATPLVVIPQHFGSLVFDHRTSRYLPFDHPATDMLIRLQTVPIDHLLHELQTDDQRDQLWRFYDHFHALGFFTLDGTFDGTTLNVPEVPADHLVGPLAVHLEVIASCNLKCTHCFADVLPRKETPLTLAELDRLFASMARMGSFRLGLTGGEPLMRRDLFEIIDLATSHGLHPCITTNGLLMTDEIAREFGKRELVWLNVSLEGATAASNDLIRGNGTFERVIEKLQVLRRHARFTLAFTITHHNYAEVEACADLAYRVGAQTAVFRPLYPVGIAQHHLELMPTFAEYQEALTALSGAGDAFDVCAVDPFSPQSREEARADVQGNYGCGAGNLVCSVSVSGQVNPCSFLGTHYVSGSLHEHSFEDIWHNSKGFKAIRALPGGTEDTFSGGCRARALVFNGSINAPDPWVGQREVIQLLPRQPEDPPAHHPMSVLEVTRKEQESAL